MSGSNGTSPATSTPEASLGIEDGFLIDVARDACGCTLTLTVCCFEQASLTGNLGGYSAEYTNLELLGTTTSVADLPGDSDRPDLPTSKMELHHVGKDDLRTWLLDFRLEHSRRSYLPEELQEGTPTATYWREAAQRWASVKRADIERKRTALIEPPLPHVTMGGLVVVTHP